MLSLRLPLQISSAHPNTRPANQVWFSGFGRTNSSQTEDAIFNSLLLLLIITYYYFYNKNFIISIAKPSHQYSRVMNNILIIIHNTWILMASSSADQVPDLPDAPHHPPSDFSFPKRDFGKKQIVKRLCQSVWFYKWKWLHYCKSITVNPMTMFCVMFVFVL